MASDVETAPYPLGRSQERIGEGEPLPSYDRLVEFDEARRPEHIDELMELSFRRGGRVMGIHIGGFETALGAKSPSGFVPLWPGLNVCYGLNGAGKTRFLDAVARLSDGLHGSSEGVCWTFGKELYESVIGGFENVGGEQSDMPCRTARLWPKRHDHEEPGKVDQVSIGGENAAILREFAHFGGVLSTWPVGSDSRAHRVLVPVCSADSVGPVTAAVRARMTRLWLKHANGIDALEAGWTSGRRGDEHRMWEEIRRLAYEAAREWGEEFADSVLFNDRNFGPALGMWDYQSWSEAWIATESPPSFLDPEAPLFLPAIAKMPTYGRESSALNYRVSSEERGRELASVELHTREGLRNAWTDYYLSPESGSRDFPGENSLSMKEVYALESEFPHFRAPPAEVHDVADRTTTDWSEQATALLARVLPGSPALKCNSGSAVDWLSGEAPKWILGGYPLEGASKAQLRWVSLVIAAVTSGPTDLLLIDEPESGLHRTAERAISSALSAPEIGEVVIAATHSPLLLDAPGAHLLRISADQGVVPWKGEYYERHLELGIAKSDLLANVTLFLLVEGEHEKVVLDLLFGTRLRTLGVRVIAMRGGAAIAGIIDSQFLFTCTEATLMVLLDNVSAESVQRVWEAARTQAQRGELGLGREGVLAWARDEPSIKGRVDERAWLVELMTAALNAGEHERFEVHGLSEPDLIYYVPSKPFVGTKTWSAVKARYVEYTEECSSRSKKPLSLKPWIERTYDRDATSPEAFRSAAEGLDRAHLPTDLNQLMEHIERVVYRSRGRDRGWEAPD